MKSKRFNHLLIIGAVVMLLFCIVMIANFVIFGSYNKINHFEDISVCKALDEYVIDEQAFDKYITDIPFVDSYVKVLNYEGKCFTIYAYQFENVETAKKYYSLIEGKTVDGDIDYAGNSNLFSSNLIARYKTNVYRIETTGTRDYVEIMKYLNSIFTITIRE